MRDFLIMLGLGVGGAALCVVLTLGVVNVIDRVIEVQSCTATRG